MDDIKYIVIKSLIPTRSALDPNVALWRTRFSGFPEELIGRDKWLSDHGLGDFEADMQSAAWVKEFYTLEEAMQVLPMTIKRFLIPVPRVPHLRLVK